MQERPRSPWRSARFAGLLAVLGSCIPVDCGPGPSSGTGGGGGTASCGEGLQRGCATVRNFTFSKVNVTLGSEAAGTSNEVAAASTGAQVVPGAAFRSVGSGVGATSTFHAFVNGAEVNAVTCTVSDAAWISVNPEVVWQANALSCQDW